MNEDALLALVTDHPDRWVYLPATQIKDLLERAVSRPDGSAVSVPLGELAGVTELAREHGVNAQTIHAWLRRYPSFPKPVKVFGTQRIWDAREVREWVKNR